MFNLIDKPDTKQVHLDIFQIDTLIDIKKTNHRC